jgi:hypothetical protein
MPCIMYTTTYTSLADVFNVGQRMLTCADNDFRFQRCSFVTSREWLVVWRTVLWMWTGSAAICRRTDKQTVVTWLGFTVNGASDADWVFVGWLVHLTNYWLATVYAACLSCAVQSEPDTHRKWRFSRSLTVNSPVISRLWQCIPKIGGSRNTRADTVREKTINQFGFHTRHVARSKSEITGIQIGSLCTE